MVLDGEPVSLVEREIFAGRDLVDRLRESIDIIAQLSARPAQPVGTIDVVTGAAEVRGLIKLAVDDCPDSILVLYSDFGDDAGLHDLLVDYAGRVRMLCPHRQRADFADRARLLRLVDRGAQVRTVSQLPQSVVIVGRDLTVLLGVDEAGLSAAQRVRDGNVAACLVGVFDQLWDSGIGVVAAEPGYELVVGDLLSTIARLMAQGLTDEAVARRLGMSVRTCRRHIAALLRDLNAVSRFQAGVQAAERLQAGLLLSS